MVSHWLMHRPVERCKHEEAFGYDVYIWLQLSGGTGIAPHAVHNQCHSFQSQQLYTGAACSFLSLAFILSYESWMFGVGYGFVFVSQIHCELRLVQLSTKLHCTLSGFWQIPLLCANVT
jgi:hypothetical protein